MQCRKAYAQGQQGAGTGQDKVSGASFVPLLTAHAKNQGNGAYLGRMCPCAVRYGRVKEAGLQWMRKTLESRDGLQFLGGGMGRGLDGKMEEVGGRWRWGERERGELVLRAAAGKSREEGGAWPIGGGDLLPDFISYRVVLYLSHCSCKPVKSLHYDIATHGLA